MNKNVIKVWALGSLLVATACSKSANEVITEDPSYKVEANEVYVDKPAKFVYSTDNFASNISSSEVQLNALVEESSVTLYDAEISFTVKLRRPLAKKLVAGEFKEGDTIKVLWENNEVAWKKSNITE